MKTMIEFWDSDPIKNVYGPAAYEAERVIYVTEVGEVRACDRDTLERFFRGMGQQPRLIYREVSAGNMESLVGVIEALLTEEPDCVFDMTGGSELAMAALGRVSAERKVPMVQFDLSTGKQILSQETGGAQIETKTPVFHCQDIVNMMGGQLLQDHGHFDGREMDPELEEDALKIWEICRNNYKQWSTHTFYLQQMETVGGDPLRMQAPEIVSRDRYNMVRCNTGILKEMAEAGILLDFELENKKVHFRYKNNKLKEMLAIAGIWLEIYCFLAGKKAGVFQDSQISALINWDGRRNRRGTDTVYNEIDVLLVRGVRPVFVSCKSGAVSASSLYEITVLAETLGGNNACKVLATTMPLNKQAPHVAARARYMGVEILEVASLSLEELGQRLKEISEPVLPDRKRNDECRR